MATLTSDRPAAVNAAAAARSTEDKSGPSARLAALIAARRCVTGLIVGRCAYHDPMAEDREFLLHLDDVEHHRLAEAARRARVSMQAYARDAISAAAQEDEALIVAARALEQYGAAFGLDPAGNARKVAGRDIRRYARLAAAGTAGSYGSIWSARRPSRPIPAVASHAMASPAWARHPHAR